MTSNILHILTRNSFIFPKTAGRNNHLFPLSTTKLVFGIILTSLILTLSSATSAQRKASRATAKSKPAATKSRTSAGQKAFDEAVILFAKDDKQSLKTALIGFEEARQLYIQAGDKRGEADSATMSGRTYRKLGNPDETIKKYAEAVSLYRKNNDKGG